MTTPPENQEDPRFQRLLEQYATLLRSLIAQHCPRGLGLQINDIEQEARVRIWRALQREKDFSDPASYIYRVAVTTTIDAVRRVRARREDQLDAAGSDEQEPAQLIDEREAPDQLAERREMMKRIAAAVAALPENRRRVVELHLQGLTLDEIAGLLQWTEAKVRNLVYRGLDDLREELRRQGIEYP